MNLDTERPETAAETPASRHCNGDDEHGENMPDFVDFPTRPAGLEGAEIDEEALAASIRRCRLTGWTAQRMRLFIQRLADIGNVHQCCRELGLSRQSAYALRRRNELFRRAWDGASIRSRDALLDEAWQRAYQGPQEEVVIDGKLVERRGRPDGAMLRYLLTRADKLAGSPALSARPAQAAELRLEELIDCLDPANAEDGEEAPDETALLAEIAASGRWQEDDRDTPSGPLGFTSDEAALEALMRHNTLMATAPEDVDVSDLDVADYENWDEDQWARADRAGLTDEIEWDEAA